MSKREFNTWLSGFRDSIADYRYYIDFEKIHRNIDQIKIELDILNSLIGSKNIEFDFENLIKKYPEVLKCIPLLLAVRTNEIYAIDGDGEFKYDFKTPNLSTEQYKIFMRKTGLFDLMENHIVNNIVDYATGVETGLDSNGRKNRGGHLMENLVENYIVDAGFVKNQTYFKEMKIKEIEVLRDEYGKPYVKLYGKALEKQKELGIERFFVSISDTKEYTSAVAVAEGKL